MPDTSLAGASAQQSDPTKHQPHRPADGSSQGSNPSSPASGTSTKPDLPPTAASKGKGKGKEPAAASSSRPSSSSNASPSSAAAVAADGASSPAAKPRPKTEALHLDQYVARDHLHSAALWEQTENTGNLVKQKRREVDYYYQLRRDIRPRNPGQVFGFGYSGYGNGTTDIPSRVLYPCQRKRTGGRESRELKLTRQELQLQADQKELLVPVRLDLEHNNIKLRDTFTWNMHDRTVPLEVFSEQLLEDFHMPVRNQSLLHTVTNSIREQVTEYHPHVYLHDEPLDPNLPYTAYKNDDMRIVIKLNITIGQHTLVDQFEWDINNPLNSPEEFASLLTRELSLSGEFTTSIAHCIREQSQLFTRALFVTSHPFDGRPVEDEDVRTAMLPSPLPSIFRPHVQQKDFTPLLYELSEGDLDRAEKSQSRESRRINRRTNRRGGPTIPDLKDMPKTHRTQIVSSTLPGAVQKLSELKKTMVAKPIKDGDSDDEDSETDNEDLPPEQRIPNFNNMTKRQRTAAMNAMKTNQQLMGRSATPEVHSHQLPPRQREIRDRQDTPQKPQHPHHAPVPQTPSVPTNSLPQQSTVIVSSSSHQFSPSPFPPLPRRPGAPPNEDSAVVVLKISSAALRKLGDSLAAQPKPKPSAPSDNAPSPAPPKRMPPPQPPGSSPGASTPGGPPPPPPSWLLSALSALHQTPTYALDRFEGTMRYTAYDAKTRAVVPQAHIAGKELHWEWTPRIRCHDCPGKLYTPGPENTVENFLMHLKNRGHRERVEARIKAAGA